MRLILYMQRAMCQTSGNIPYWWRSIMPIDGSEGPCRPPATGDSDGDQARKGGREGRVPL